MFKKTLLGAAIAAIAATSAAQAESFTDNSFFSDSSLKLTYKNYYWNERDRNTNAGGVSKYDRREWTQAVVADFQSGYFADVIGFDYSFTAADSLDNPGNPRSNSNLPVSGGKSTADPSRPGYAKGTANGIAGTSQAYLKAKFGDDNLNAYATYGLKKRGFETFGDSGSRIQSSATYGVDVDANVYGLNLYAAQITGQHQRDSSNFKDSLQGDTSKVDDVNIYGASYEFDFGLGLTAEYSESDDYSKKKFFRADYGFDVAEGYNLALDARYGKSEAQENNSNYADGADANYYNVNATLSFADAYVALGYSKVRDGEYDNAHFDSDYGTFNSSTSLWVDYLEEDEKTYVISAGYDFAGVGIEGLTYDVFYSRGSDAVGTSGSHHSWENVLGYSFGGNLDGLKVQWYNATSRGYKGDEDVNRLNISYTYLVF